MADPNYQEIESSLAASRALTDLPEAHGTLAGALCSSRSLALEDWLREIFPEGQAGAAETSLLAVFEWTRHVLDTRQFGFQPLLPDDETPVEARAVALGQWCQGFLYGLGSQPIPEIEHLPAEVAEIVRDFTALTQIGVDAGESPEANEQAYAELVEFVRIGVQLLYDELAKFRDDAASSAGNGPAPAFH